MLKRLDSLYRALKCVRHGYYIWARIHFKRAISFSGYVAQAPDMMDSAGRDAEVMDFHRWRAR